MKSTPEFEDYCKYVVGVGEPEPPKKAVIQKNKIYNQYWNVLKPIERDRVVS